MNPKHHTNLVEPVLATITDIDDLYDLRHQPLIKHIALTQLRLEVGTTREHEPGHVHLVRRDEVLHGQLGYLAHVVVTLLVTKTGETQGGLTTTAVLLREVDGEFVDDLAGVACDGTKERAVTVHDDEPKLGIRFKKLLQRFSVEFVVAKVEGTVHTQRKMLNRFPRE